MIEIPLPVLDQGRERLLQRVGGHHGLDGAAEIERVYSEPSPVRTAGTCSSSHSVTIEMASHPPNVTKRERQCALPLRADTASIGSVPARLEDLSADLAPFTDCVIGSAIFWINLRHARHEYIADRGAAARDQL
ncbi:hypothetical protein G6F57_021332 [Rhizopus arrhizus]|nr:hypothetical protein G6F57_021332 [Rhizopus arrhizus]